MRPSDIINSRTHESQHDTGVVLASSGYLKWIGTGHSANLDIDTVRPTSEAGYLASLAVRIGAGSRSITFDLNVNSSTVVSVTATITTTWQFLTPRRAGARFEVGDLLAIGFSGASAGVDRLVIVSEWRR